MRELIEFLSNDTDSLIKELTKRKGNFLYDDEDLDNLTGILVGMKFTIMELSDDLDNPTLIRINQGVLKRNIKEMEKIIAKDDLSPFKHLINGLSQMVQLLRK